MIKNENFSLQRLTALWAFSEAALGGLLHALHIPFSGVVLGGFAIMFISLIAYYSKNHSEILKALAIVLAVKFAVSPHTPIGAYISVSVQGLAGYLVFRFIKNYRFSVFILSVFAMLFSSMQKIIVYIILFGFDLINSINMFISISTKQLPFLKSLPNNFNYGLFIISVYLGVYLISGFVIGFIISKLPKWLDDAWENNLYKNIEVNNKSNQVFFDAKKKKKSKKKTVPIILSVSILLLIFSYLFPQYEKLESTRLLIIIIRALSILAIWYLIVIPILSKILKKFVQKSKSKYSEEVDEIINLFPLFKETFITGWQYSRNERLLNKVKYFLVFLILTFLTKE